MDYIKKILNFLKKRNDHDDTFMSFSHVPEDSFEKVITIHSDADGMVVMSVFTLEEFAMIKDVIDLTGGDPYEIITGLSKEKNITTIVFDPKDFG